MEVNSDKQIYVGSGNIKTSEGFKSLTIKKPWLNDVFWYRAIVATKDTGLGSIVMLGVLGVLWIGTLDFNIVSCCAVLGFSWFLGFLIRAVR